MRNKPYAIFLIVIWVAIMLLPLTFLVSPSEASSLNAPEQARATATPGFRRLPPVTSVATRILREPPVVTIAPDVKPLPTRVFTRVPPVTPIMTNLPPATPTSVPTEVPTVLPPIGDDAQCYACHVTGSPVSAQSAKADRATLPNGQAPLAVQVTTHGNNFNGKSETPFFLSCTQCHEAHGNTGNLKAVLVYVKVKTSPVITTGPVIFTAYSGTNSFDDNVSPDVNRLCVTCHTNTNDAGYPMSSHLGGFNHKLKNSLAAAGTSANTGDWSAQNCVSCHPHNGTGKAGVYDGFMPLAGCTQCHAEATDDPTVAGPAGGRRAIVPEFANAAGGIRSHHALSTTNPSAATITDVDCIVCHKAEQGAHADGKVELTNVDTGATYTETAPGAFRPISLTLADSKSLTPFCLACHDTDGATTLGAARAITPFSDGLIVPNIVGTDAATGLWSASAHATGGSTNSGYGCMSCHDNGHGSNLDNLLSSSASTLGVGNYYEEEGFCYKCHAGSPATTDVKTEFSLASHHMVSDTEQLAGTSGRGVIECANCHNAHRSNTTQPLVNPENRTQLWPAAQKGERDFCLTCHDGTPPTSTNPLPFLSQFPVSFTGTYSGTGWNKTAYISTTHDVNLSGPECRACHDRHGATTYSMLSKAYNKTYPSTYSSADYALCWTCHQESLVRSTNAFGDLHTSVAQHDVPCIHCHDVHNPYDAGERGLINFSYAAKWFAGFALAGGTTQSSAYQATGSTMTCGTLNCHNADSHIQTYTPAPIYTTSCGNCHDTSAGATPIRRQILDSLATGLGIGGEFKAAPAINISYHMTPTIYNTSTLRNTKLISDCTVCHEFSTHMQKTVVLKDPDSQLMIAYPTGGTAYGKALQMQAFCQNCHDGNGAKRLGTKALKPFNDGKTAVVVSVHSNINFFLPEEARFQVTCLQCHTNANHGSTNLSVVGPTLIITGNLTSGPINFKSLTGLNSFDDGASATSSRICVACHANPGDPGFPMTSHSGGNHPIMGDSRGENCTDFGCHMHDQDGNPATLDGFVSY